MNRLEYIKHKERLADIDYDRKLETKEFVVDVIKANLDFETVLDLGCGKIKYDFGKVFRVDANDTYGPDLVADLGQVLDLGKYDLVFSTEVAEHIEPEFADNFVENLTKHAEKWIFMTASPPSKVTKYTKEAHLNEQLKDYWVKKLEARGFKNQPELAEKLQNIYRTNKRIMNWYIKDIIVYKRWEKIAERYHNLYVEK